MAKTSLGSAKRYGVRYGRTVREKVSKVEKVLRKKHKCPYCNKPGLTRASAGIWYCKKCGVKFVGQAYNPSGRGLEKTPEA